MKPGTKQTFSLYLSDEEYAAFRADPRTRLTDHSRSSSGEVTIKTAKPYALASDLEAVIDFGATSAQDVLGLSPRF